MNSFKNIDKAEALKVLYAQDSAAKAILEWFGERQKDASEIAVDRAAHMAKVEHRDVVRVFRKFEELEFGKFLVGRRGSKSRMIFDLSIRSLAAAATQRGEEPKQLDPEDLEDLVDDDDIEWGQIENVAHKFQLRPDFEVRISLPQNFTEKEAERLAIFVKSLPFE